MLVAPIDSLASHALVARIRQQGADLGFDLVGIASADPSRHREYFRRWIDEGKAGEMHYLANKFDERADPGQFLPGAKSVICVAMNYYASMEPAPNAPADKAARSCAAASVLSSPRTVDVGKDAPVRSAGPTAPAPDLAGSAPRTANAGGDETVQDADPTRSIVHLAPQGRIARYALGDDYHEMIKDRLHDLADWLRATVPGTRTRCGVDTAPVMERELAARAGIGWIGKNTCIIHPQLGSWLLLGEVVTSLELPADDPITDHCGTCTRCIDACPTAAITAPYELDARRCISYLTIEQRSEIPSEMRAPIGDWLYGCDVCQDVCPHNNRAPAASDPALQPRFKAGTLDVDEIAVWTDAEYRATLKGSAMKRVKLPMLQRNAAIVAENARFAPTKKQGAHLGVRPLPL